MWFSTTKKIPIKFKLVIRSTRSWFSFNLIEPAKKTYTKVFRRFTAPFTYIEPESFGSFKTFSQWLTFTASSIYIEITTRYFFSSNFGRFFYKKIFNLHIFYFGESWSRFFSFSQSTRCNNRDPVIHNIVFRKGSRWRRSSI